MTSELCLLVDTGLGQRERHAGTIELNRADLIHRGGIDPAQVARDSDRGVAIGAVEDVKAQQLLLGFGGGTIDHRALAGAAQDAGAFRSPKPRRRSYPPLLQEAAVNLVQ